jgi:hypothetical protein
MASLSFRENMNMPQSESKTTSLNVEVYTPSSVKRKISFSSVSGDDQARAQSSISLSAVDIMYSFPSSPVAMYQMCNKVLCQFPLRFTATGRGVGRE